MGKQLYCSEIHSKNIANLFVKDMYQHYYKVHNVIKYVHGKTSLVIIWLLRFSHIVNE